MQKVVRYKIVYKSYYRKFNAKVNCCKCNFEFAIIQQAMAVSRGYLSVLDDLEKFQTSYDETGNFVTQFCYL